MFRARRSWKYAAAPLLGLVVALVLAAPAVAAPVVGPSGSAFYTPPSPLPPGNHGDLIWYRPVTVNLGAGAPAVNAWIVMYHSQRLDGQADVVTGTVLVPQSPWTSGPRPVVDYAMGTQGLSQASAPSVNLVAGTEYENVDLDQALSKGWAVVTTDYVGYTNGGSPDYIVGHSEGHAMLDMFKAATEVPGSGVSPDAKVVTWGYSQGGSASAWAAELWPTYSPWIKLVGDASGGVPANLNAVADSLNGGLGFAFLLYAVGGLQTDYPSLINLYSHTNAAGVAAVSTIESQTVFESLLSFAFQNIDQYTVGGETLDQLLATPSIQEAVSAQQLGTIPIHVPVYLYHSAIDEIIPIGQAQTLAQTYCNEGVTVDWHVYPTPEHLLGDFLSAGDVVNNWIAPRFEGLPAPSTC